MSDAPDHEKFVESWLSERIDRSNATSTRLSRLLLMALRTIWTSSRTTLGEVTLGAIFSRVFETTRRTHPLLAAAQSPNAEPWSLDIGDLVEVATPAELERVVRYILVEVLSVLGRLTGEALTQNLHAALTAIDRDLDRADEESSAKLYETPNRRETRRS